MTVKYGSVLLMVLAIGICGGQVCAAMDTQEVSLEFAKANEAFRQANDLAGKGGADDEAKKLYVRATMHYERIVAAGGIRNAKLYYNLGNAYLLKGDLGRAVVNYRRAEKLDSGDADIQKNLAFARSRRIDKVQVQTQRKVMRTLFFWHYDFSLRVRFLAGCIAFGGLFVFLTLLVWLGRSGVRSGLAAGAAISLVIAVGFLASVGVESVYEAKQPCGVIIAESVVARQGDGTNYLPSFKEPLHAGTEFELIEQRMGWVEIQLSDGSQGWVPDDSAELL